MNHTSVDTRLGADEDQGFQPGFSHRRPVFARELLALLGVDGASEETQRNAVRDWLAQNVPGRSLSRSLRRAGLA
jgi:hypothetical protein